MKNTLFILTIVFVAYSLFFTLGKWAFPDSSLSFQRDYAILSGIKFLTTIALYIAWRVTPESK